MKPLKLILKGFTGVAGHPNGQIELDLRKIPDTAVLVAIVGPNGSGKTTILDNLHPYRVMPSRATTMTPGGFSYWDNISGKEACKELLWEHDGVEYLTVLKFRQTGKTRKAECYLLKDMGDDLFPVEAGGVVSDGKSDTYDAVVEAILGKPERFFTAQFSAQNRKLLSDYAAGEIKCLLASILSLDAYKACSEKANEVAKLLQAHVSAMKEQSQKAIVAMKDKTQAEAALDTLKAECKAAKESVEKAAAATGSAVAEVSRIQVLLEQEAERESQRQAIGRRIAEVKADAVTEEAKANTADSETRQQLTSDIETLRKEVDGITRQDGALKAQVAKDRELLAKEEAIREAAAELLRIQKGIATLEARIAEGRKALAQYAPVKKAILEVSKELADITAKGKAVKQRIIMLKDTSAQLDAVPCKGNVQCPLIANAINARDQLNPVEGERQDLCEQYKALKAKLESLEKDEKAAEALESQVAGQEERLKTGLKKEAELKVISSQLPVLSDAKERIAQMEATLAENARKAESLASRITAAQKRESEMAEAHAKAIESIRNKAQRETQALSDQLQKLGEGISKGVLELAKAKAKSCQDAEEKARGELDALTKRQVSLMATIEACDKIQAAAKPLLDGIARLEGEIVQFRLIEKGFGVNGIIALSIDDAGPAVAAICNQLLHDCFDGRFSVRLNTQKATQKGDVRETFDVIVFDNVKGGEKELGMMSGGERVWVNECLTRAIALYVAQTSDTRFETLFTDEADGALDPERKRQFVAMKRAIMKQGGYSREYFVSQTPELWDMADYVIHVDEL